MFLWFLDGSNATFAIPKSTVHVKGGKGPLINFLGVMIQISRSHSDITLSKLDWLTMRH